MIGEARFEGFQEGVENERKEWVKTLLPQSAEITIRVRGEKDDVNTIRKVLSFEEIKSSELKVLRYAADEAVIEIATKGKILKSLIENG